MFPNLICIYEEPGVSQPDEKKYKHSFIMDYLPGEEFLKAFDSCRYKNLSPSDIDSIIKCQKFIPSDLEIRSFMEQSVMALNDLQKVSLAIVDIKPSNIMYYKGELKFFDMNGSSHSTDKNLYVVSTKFFAAPETKNSHIFGINVPETDIFSLGIIFHMMVGYKSLHRGLSASEAYKKIYPYSYGYTLKMLRNDNCAHIDSPPLFNDIKLGTQNGIAFDLAYKMLNFHTYERITLDEIKKHKYFEGTNWDNLEERFGSQSYMPNLVGVKLTLDINYQNYDKNNFDTIYSFRATNNYQCDDRRKPRPLPVLAIVYISIASVACVSVAAFMIWKKVKHGTLSTKMSVVTTSPITL
ncbi:Protein kinase-like domain-containing protein [Rozella allomycis CSF55]|uniref:Protein kinase-like domain-containing protein n=1 Tax=Rozella allomycis (strain CSF55) TaxID=988480 RepID=A0A075AUI9_ROZAC|nr:Protein kinase-like domain-containing protein [Rozella allomycis CSF55]|eukprot:EPZ33961.1 Protein kinase-like domain-containing protein [Rozella allomycis CSF55]